MIRYDIDNYTSNKFYIITPRIDIELPHCQRMIDFSVPTALLNAF